MLSNTGCTVSICEALALISTLNRIACILMFDFPTLVKAQIQTYQFSLEGYLIPHFNQYGCSLHHYSSLGKVSDTQNYTHCIVL